MPPFVRVNANLQNHRKTARLCRTLNISIQEAIGALAMLWIATRSDAPDGNLEQFSPDDVAAATGFGGEDGAKIEAAFVDAGFLDRDERGKLLVHDWMEHNGSHIKDAERMREVRQRNGSVQERSRTFAHSLVEKEIEKEKKIESKALPPSGGASSTDSLREDSRQGIAKIVVGLSGAKSLNRVSAGAPLMDRVKAAVKGLSRTQADRIFPLVGWLSKTIPDDERLLRVVDDAIAKGGGIKNLHAYYAENGPARAEIEGTHRAEAQERESEHWKAVDRQWLANLKVLAKGGG